jgi:gliding motility-associated-like protein
MRYFWLTILLVLSNFIAAQNETNIWYFGQNAGLDFNSGNPVVLLDGQLDTDEGCSAISDTLGNLLFYTDGVTVYNRNHVVMVNGDALNGSFSSTHSAIIVPKPNDSNIYYIFTTDFQAGSNGLQFSEVDMSLDGGLGGITGNKNVLLFTPTTEKLTAIKNSTDNSYWVISHKWESDEFIAYQVTETGVNVNPVISAVGTYIGGSDTAAAAGQIKISPEGTKLAVARTEGFAEAQLFDFDSSTGLISNPITLLDLANDELVYGVEFSPNSQLLYISVLGNGIYQFNLNAGSNNQIIYSQFLITTLARPYSAMQLATNGKIYVAKPNQFQIDVINNPNGLGASCDFQFESVDLGGRRSQYGLPPFIQSFFQVGFEVENLCFGEVAQFNANISQPYDSLLWEFGDSTTSVDESPIHAYTSPGVYDVQLTVTVGAESSSETKEVIIYEQPIANQPSDILICDDNNDGFYAFDLTSRDIEVLNGQSNTTFDIVYFASLDDYNNDIAISNPNSHTNANSYSSETIIASIRNALNESCEDMTQFDIHLFESPTPSQNLPDLSFCDDVSVGSDSDGIIIFDLTENETLILNGQSSTDFSVSYYSDNGFTSQITNPSNYQNVNLNQVIYVRVFNNSNLECIGETSFSINVYELPIVNSPVILSQCDDDLDGFSEFNLNEVILEITANSSNETITFYESLTEAETVSNAITSITNYENENVSSDIIWARIENQNGCYRTSQVNLTVSTTQIPNKFSRDFYQCDDGIDSTDGVATFNFSSVNTEIEALFPSGQQLVINYYRNQSDALSESNPVTDISNYQNIGFPNSQEIYIRVDSAVDNDCLGLGSYITLYVDPNPLITGPVIIELCDENNDGSESFDTSGIEAELLQGQTETISFSFIDELGVNYGNSLPNPLTSNQPILNIFATMTATNPNNPNGGCSVETTISLVIDNGAVANPVNDFIVCDDNDDGEFAFDTSNIEATVISGQTNVTVSYFAENGDMLPSPLPNPFVTSNQTITVRVQDITSTFCFSETTFDFVVNSQPIAYPIVDDIVCDDLSNDGEHVFMLSGYNTQILNGQSSFIFEILYFDDNDDALGNQNELPDSYLVNSQSQTVFVRIQNSNNPDCFEITSFDLGVLFVPIANQPTDLFICDDESNDGFESFDLTDQNVSIFNGQSETENSISFYLSQEDADDSVDQISNNFTNTQNPQTIYVRLENNLSSECYTTTSFDLVVNELPIIDIEDEVAICEGETIELEVDSGYDEYLWSTGDTTREITVNEAGSYTITVTNNYGSESCSVSKTITVIESNVASIIDIETIDWSQNNNTITIFVEGSGDYEYSIDGFTYQDSNEFINLAVDEYTVYVRDKNGCGEVSEDIYLLYYPKFLTPNGDGYHDFWQLYSANREPGNKLFIYDRYGKLLKFLKSTDYGWDGFYNGTKLPASDYWFRLERQNGKQYTGHFSLRY